jgi:hypothetical protein
MTRLSRRSVLRAGGCLALATTIAGCTGSSDSGSTTNDGIPGVEDGEIVDNHSFANAHSDQLASRSGTLEWTRVSLDSETADPKIHTLWTVHIEGNRVHADVTGRALISGNGVDRLEFYFGDDTTFYRTKTDGTWETRSADQPPISKSELTGKSTLEAASMRKVGTETAYGEKLHRFSNVIHQPDGERVEWFSVQALVDENALGYTFQRTLDGKGENTHRTDEWHVTDLGSTTVERPDWVEG